MDFARKILNKYGWKEGEGLGKHSNGIVKPLKASMKFDNAGLGADQAATDFNNHWWERVFNEAAGNVKVKSGENGVSMELKNKGDSVEISTKGYSVNKLKKAKESSSTNDTRYDNFLQSSTLTKSGDELENPNKIAVADISVTQYKTLTDEELFQACGGRTAHKGARHGLKLSGKLSRIEQQEKELLAKMHTRIRNTSEELSQHELKREVKRNKRKNIRNESVVEDEMPGTAEKKPEVPQCLPEKSSKKNKRSKIKEFHPEESSNEVSTHEVNLKRRRKESKLKLQQALPHPTDADVAKGIEYADNRKKKRKDDSDICDANIDSKKSKKFNKMELKTT